MTIKWHWGTKIILVYLGFVAFMLFMVFLCTRQHFDLVTPDYYAQELQFQQVIDGQKNVAALGKEMTIASKDNNVVITLPSANINGKGVVKFYRPNNANLDFSVPVEANGVITIPASRLITGLYKVKASWMVDKKPYYSELSYNAQ